MFEVEPGETVTDQLSVFEDDGFTKHSGLVAPADFTISVWRNGVVDALPVTITEIGTSGEYKVVYTPSAVGFWLVQVAVPYNEDIFESRAAVGTGATLSGVKEDLSIIMGLLHLNGILDNHTYDPVSQLLSARLRIFNSPSNVPALPGGSEVAGLKYEFQISATYQGVNEANKFTLKRVL